MALQSDIDFNPAKFDPKNVREGTKKLNDGLIAALGKVPGWWEVCLLIHLLHSFHSHSRTIISSYLL